jgi:hypothetical protein
MLGKNRVFNTDLISLLKKERINVDDALTYLLSLYYEIKPSYIPQKLESAILALNIVNRNFSSNVLVWNINLFEEQITNFEWIEEFRNMFKSINPDRVGTKIDTLKRMKKFLQENPMTSVSEILEATRLYLGTLTNSVYCKKAHKFIYDTEGSVLLEYIEKLREKKKSDFEDLI